MSSKTLTPVPVAESRKLRAWCSVGYIHRDVPYSSLTQKDWGFESISLPETLALDLVVAFVIQMDALGRVLHSSQPEL